jgi:hypothetical protein
MFIGEAHKERKRGQKREKGVRKKGVNEREKGVSPIN